MHVIDVTQNKQIKFMLAALISLGGLTAFLIYMEERKHRTLKADLLNLDKQIKELTLAKLKNGNSK